MISKYKNLPNADEADKIVDDFLNKHINNYSARNITLPYKPKNSNKHTFKIENRTDTVVIIEQTMEIELLKIQIEELERQLEELKNEPSND